MENIPRLYLITTGIAAAYFLSGVVLLFIASFEPMLAVGCVFSLIGVLAAFYGARKNRQVWWASGIMVVGFLTPTVWGMIPMIISLVLVTVIMWWEWKVTKDNRD